MLRLLDGLRRARAGDDRGSAIVNVLVLMVVTSIVAVAMGTSIVVSGSVTLSSSQSVRSEAAADAGIDFARAQIAAGDPGCSGWDQSGADPAFTVAAPVYRDAGGATVACTTPLLPTVVSATVVSTGYSPGAAATTDQVGAQFAVTAATPVAEEGTGPAAYMYNGGGLNAFTISVPAGFTEPGDLIVPTGNLNCSGASTIQGSVIVATGSASFSNSCRILGNLEAAGTIELRNSNQVQGHVYSAGGNISIDAQSAVIAGDVWAGGSVTAIAGATIGGSVTGRGSATTNYNPNSTVNGDLTLGGSINSWGGTSGTGTYQQQVVNWLSSSGKVRGTIRQNQTGLTAPVLPAAPSWLNWANYTDAEWNGFGHTTIINWPSTNCEVNNYSKTVAPLAGILATIQNATTPVVVNALGCSRLLFSASAGLSGASAFRVRTDVVFVSNGFQLENMTIDSGDGVAHELRFLVPDGSPTVSGPQCGSGDCAFNTNSGVSVTSRISAIVYTPGNVALNNSAAWRGQLYSRSMTVSSNDGLVYVPVGIPGMNLDSGEATVPEVETGSVDVTSRYPIG